MIDFWVYCPTIPRDPLATVSLDESEARHATASRRLREGDQVSLFDGCGAVASATIVRTTRDAQIEVRIDGVREVARATPVIEIACALPKGDRLGSLMEAIGPLEASSFTPLLCAHSVAQWSPAIESRAMRVLIASCKQSRQAWLPRILPQRTVAQAADDAAKRGAKVFVAHPDGGPLGQLQSFGHAAIFIGPEGGFTQQEVDDACASGAQRVSLGQSILRIELAAACAIARIRVS